MIAILFILSTILFFITPTSYSLLFCICCLSVFLFGAVIIIKKDVKQIGWVNYNLFFLLSFFLCTYAFPVFMYPTGFDGILGTQVSEKSINICTSMATMAISFYYLSYLYGNKRFSKRREVPIYSSVTKRRIFSIFLIILVFILFTLFRFLLSSSSLDIEVSEAPFAFLLFDIVLAIALLGNSFTGKISIKNFLLLNKTYLLFTVLVLLIFVFIGDRKPIMEIGLIIVAAYSLLYNKINPKLLFISIILAGTFMAMLGITRNTSSSLRSGGLDSFVQENRSVISDESFNYWVFFADLTERYEELYQGYEYVEKNGYQYGLRIIPLLFSPIPLAPNIISEMIYEKPLSKTAPGALIGKYWDVHAGTHCIADLYMPWGVPGVILFFSLFGYIIGFITRNSTRNCYCSLFYILLVAQAIFMPRGSLFDIYRPIVWGYFLMYFLNRNKHSI